MGSPVSPKVRTTWTRLSVATETPTSVSVSWFPTGQFGLHCGVRPHYFRLRTAVALHVSGTGRSCAQTLSVVVHRCRRILQTGSVTFLGGKESDRREAAAGERTTLPVPKRIASDTAEINSAPSALASSTCLSPLAALRDDEDIWSLLSRTRESLL